MLKPHGDAMKSTLSRAWQVLLVMVCLIIIGVIVGNVPSLVLSTGKLKQDVTVSRIRAAMIAILEYCSEQNGQPPPSIESAVQGERLPDIAHDAWGNHFHYSVKQGNIFTISSWGRDGKQGGDGLSQDLEVSVTVGDGTPGIVILQGSAAFTNAIYSIRLLQR
jgi:type II secretory pathway pseudopilin PulG